MLWLAYGALSAICLALAWGVSGARAIGLAMAASWATSNMIAFGLPFWMRPMLFPLIDVGVGCVASFVYLRRPSFWPFIVLVLSMLSAMSNLVYSFHESPNMVQSYNYAFVLNVIFALQCLCAGGWGMSDAIRRNRHIPVLRHSSRLGDQLDSRRGFPEMEESILRDGNRDGR